MNTERIANEFRQLFEAEADVTQNGTVLTVQFRTPFKYATTEPALHAWAETQMQRWAKGVFCDTPLMKKAKKAAKTKPKKAATFANATITYTDVVIGCTDTIITRFASLSEEGKHAQYETHHRLYWELPSKPRERKIRTQRAVIVMEGIARYIIEVKGKIVYDSADTYPVFKSLAHAQRHTQAKHELFMRRTRSEITAEEHAQLFRKLTEQD